MKNHRLLGVYAIITLLLPISIQSALTDGIHMAKANTQSEVSREDLSTLDTIIEELIGVFENDEETDKKPVTTLETSKSGAPVQPEVAEPELSPAEEQLLALQEWKDEFPTFDESTHQTEFIEAIAPAAVLIANAHGIYPSVMIAQAGLESSWGQSGLAQTYNNLMGTKGSWEGESVEVRTREEVNGESIYINDGFSVYDSWADSLHRYGKLMENGLNWNAEFYKGTWRENATNYTDATAWLQGRYATDSAYATKLNQTIQSYNLDQYDDIESFDQNLEETLAQLTLKE